MILSERGHFKLPKEDISFYGKLTINDNGKASLISESFGISPEDHMEIIDMGQDIITGRLIDSDSYVLLSEITRLPNDFFSMDFEFISNCCVISKSEITKNSFSEISLSLDNLDNWTSPGFIKVNKDEGNTLTVTSTAHDGMSWELLTQKVILELENKIINTAPYNFSHPEYKIENKSIFKFRKPDSGTSTYFLNITNKLEELISILVDKFYQFPFPIIHWQIDGKKQSGILYYPRPFECDEMVKASPTSISFAEVASNFGGIFEKWLSCSESLGPAAHLYIGAKRNNKLYEEHRFISYAWGLESLDRRTEQTFLSTSHQDRIKKCDSCIEKIRMVANDESGGSLDASERKFLKGLIKNAKSPTLAERLYRLLSPILTEVKEHNIITFCEECAHLRNILSHEGGAKASNKYQDFIIRVRKVEPILGKLYSLALMLQVGVDKDIINKKVFNNGMPNLITSRMYSAGLIDEQEFMNIKSRVYNTKK